MQYPTGTSVFFFNLYENLLEIGTVVSHNLEADEIDIEQLGTGIVTTSSANILPNNDLSKRILKQNNALMRQLGLEPVEETEAVQG